MRAIPALGRPVSACPSSRILPLLVVLSTAACLSAQLDKLIRDHGNNYRQGSSIVRMGDVDGDSLADYAVLEDFRIRVYSGISGKELRSTTSLASFGNAGMWRVGDVDNDGIRDVADAHTSRGSNNQGVVRILSGKWFATGSGSVVMKTIEGPPSLSNFGVGVGDVGDVDGDGHDDFTIGGAGRLHLYSGKTLQPVWTYFSCIQANAFSDLDNDGTNDILAWNGVKIAVVSGKSGKELRSNATGFGDLDTIGDVDNDGILDYVVGDGVGGKAIGFSGAQHKQLYMVSQTSGFANRVFRVGDADGDGEQDFLATHTFGTRGPARIFSGKSGTFLYSLRRQGWWNGDYLGDVNGDGIGDYILGNYRDAHNGNGAAVYSSRTLVMSSDEHDVVGSAGGTVNFTLHPGVQHALKSYVILGSVSGTQPGFSFGGVKIPLNPDLYTSTLLAAPNTWIAGSLGKLGYNGRAPASMKIPAGLVKLPVVLHHVAVVFSGSLEFASAPVSLVIR